MNFIREIDDDIFRLKVPFEDLYTSVFLIKTQDGYILVDCATTDSDVDEWIVPALAKKGLCLKDIRYLILTHQHGDHAGGKERILRHNPAVRVIERGEEINQEIEIYPMAGHTLDCIGVLHKSSGTLLSGDGLQGAGIKKYRCSLASKDEYFKTIERIEQDNRIKNILFSHAYEPWYKDGVFSREQVMKILQDCKNCVKGE
jgi:glyoxylase-like metal-dependent hydrolase (beta-lactamase superfamily II)